MVISDFNKKIFSDEKLGSAKREAKEMMAFRECLNKCGLVDLGFIGQKYRWCNGRFGGDRTKLRLDRAVANEDWMLGFLDARVFHSSIYISDHYLIKLSLKRGQNRRSQKRRFMFEAMWIRDTRCREVVESAWDLGGNLSSVQLIDRLRNCKEMLKSWN